MPRAPLPGEIASNCSPSAKHRRKESRKHPSLAPRTERRRRTETRARGPLVSSKCQTCPCQKVERNRPSFKRFFKAIHHMNAPSIEPVANPERDAAIGQTANVGEVDRQFVAGESGARGFRERCEGIVSLRRERNERRFDARGVRTSEAMRFLED